MTFLGLTLNGDIVIERSYFGRTLSMVPFKPFSLDGNIHLKSQNNARVKVTFLNVFKYNLEQLKSSNACSQNGALITWEMLTWKMFNEPRTKTSTLKNICTQKTEILFDIGRNIFGSQSKILKSPKNQCVPVF